MFNAAGERRRTSRAAALRRVAVGAASILAGAVLVSAPVAPGAGATQRRDAPTALIAERTLSQVGTILVDAAGRTLYTYTKDRPDHVTCTGGCARVWPPYLLPKGDRTVRSAHGIAGLGTIRRPGDRLQVTDHKWPLYLYIGDARAGEVNGEGVEHDWYAATPSGAKPLAARAAAAPPTSPTTTAPPAAPSPATHSAGSTAAAPGGAASKPSTGSSNGAPAASPPVAASPPATTSPPVTAPPTTSPPTTSPPTTSPPPTTPPTTTPPTTAGGGVSY